jgi:signal transduction histidine kinase
MGYTQLLQAGDLDESVKADLQKIYDDALRAQRIVQDLLTFARQKKPQRSPADVNEAIERTLALRSYELTVYNIEIVTELEENLPWTMADGYQLQQVFLNIVNNAYQAMSQQGGAGVLAVRSECIGDDTIRVTFTDTGPGIPPQVLERIFDPFFTTKDVGMGTGGVRLTWGQLCGSPFPSSRGMNTGNWSTWTRSARHANQTNSQGHPLRPADARGRSRQACLHKRIRL